MTERFNTPEYLIADAIGHYGVLQIALPAFPQYADEIQRHLDTIRQNTTPEGLTDIAKANGQDVQAEWFLKLQQEAFQNA